MGSLYTVSSFLFCLPWVTAAAHPATPPLQAERRAVEADKRALADMQYHVSKLEDEVEQLRARRQQLVAVAAQQKQYEDVSRQSLEALSTALEAAVVANSHLVDLEEKLTAVMDVIGEVSVILGGKEPGYSSKGTRSLQSAKPVCLFMSGAKCSEWCAWHARVHNEPWFQNMERVSATVATLQLNLFPIFLVYE